MRWMKSSLYLSLSLSIMVPVAPQEKLCQVGDHLDKGNFHHLDGLVSTNQPLIDKLRCLKHHGLQLAKTHNLISNGYI